MSKIKTTKEGKKEGRKEGRNAGMSANCIVRGLVRCALHVHCTAYEMRDIRCLLSHGPLC